MGPRLFRRGNGHAEARYLRLDPASMGPRLFRRGNALLEPVAILRAHASMGPRLFRRGNRGGKINVLPPVTALQWGHVFSDVETSPTTPPSD